MSRQFPINSIYFVASLPCHFVTTLRQSYPRHILVFRDVRHVTGDKKEQGWLRLEKIETGYGLKSDIGLLCVTQKCFHTEGNLKIIVY